MEGWHLLKHAFCTGFVLALLSAGGTAAEFIQYAHGDAGGSCPQLRTIAVAGEIKPGDFERLHAMLPEGQAAHVGAYEPVGRIVFDSPGGDYFEAVKIAHLLRGYRMQSYVAAPGRCDGACAIAFMGGTGIAMEGYYPPDRRFEPGAAITLRLPSFTDLGEASDASLEKIADSARDSALQLFVRLMELAALHEWSEATLRVLMDGGPGASVDLTDAGVAWNNKLAVGYDCRLYRQWEWGSEWPWDRKDEGTAVDSR